MNYISPPAVLIALIAFLIYIDSSYEFHKIVLREYPWQNQSTIRFRLRQIGRSQERDYENFRIAQMTLIALAVAAISILYFLTILHISGALTLGLITAVIIILITERNLTRRVKFKRETVESEFPAIIELLALSIGAGESPASAFRRIAQRAQGDFAQHIRRVVEEVEKGTSFIDALDSMGRELDLESVRLFTDSMVVAISRGTSLIETLGHTVQESRNQSRVRLISAASKSEVSMLIPVVFLILPVSILFALFPSLTNLNLFAS